MTTNDFTKIYQNLKKGSYVSITYNSTSMVNGVEYEKITTKVARFVKYANIKGVVVKGKINPNEQVIIPNTLYYNEKTKNYLVQFGTIKNSNLKSKKTYYVNGVETDKATYELGVKPRAYNGVESSVFRIKLDNIISINQAK